MVENTVEYVCGGIRSDEAVDESLTNCGIHMCRSNLILRCALRSRFWIGKISES
eukprot:SAG11_NODE_274_length_11310_cov_4.717510_5_plen_54_part_00